MSVTFDAGIFRARIERGSDMSVRPGRGDSRRLHRVEKKRRQAAHVHRRRERPARVACDTCGAIAAASPGTCTHGGRFCAVRGRESAQRRVRRSKTSRRPDPRNANLAGVDALSSPGVACGRRVQTVVPSQFTDRQTDSFSFRDIPRGPNDVLSRRFGGHPRTVTASPVARQT